MKRYSGYLKSPVSHQRVGELFRSTHIFGVVWSATSVVPGSTLPIMIEVYNVAALAVFRLITVERLEDAELASTLWPSIAGAVLYHNNLGEL
jgi:hypothetical protein